MAQATGVPKRVLEQLDDHRDALVDQVYQGLRERLFESRAYVRPADLKRIAAAEADTYVDFIERPDGGAANARGAHLCEVGLSERAVLNLGPTLRRWCRAHLTDDALMPALEVTEAYHSGVVEGFIQERQIVVLEEQERIRSALQKAITRHMVQMEVAAEVARAATSILDMDELLTSSVGLIGERFDLYYVGIFLVDEYGAWAVLRAGTGEPGQEMLRRGHKLKVGGNSMIGWSTAQGEPRIALNVGEEEVRFDNPLLPRTQSEMALPLISRGRVVGAMTVQSERVAAFSDEDITILQTMADQLANAIQNARLFAESRTRAEEMEAAYRRQLREEWAEFQADEADRGSSAYVYDLAEATTNPAGEVWTPEMERAVIERSVVALTDLAAESGDGRDDLSRDAQAALASPIILRGENIGALSLYEVEEGREWTDDDVALVEEVSAQAALALENARLYREAVKTAERLREVDRLKSQFLANMSHELRTPLNSIIGFSRVILKGIDGPLTDQQREDLEAIHGSGQHLLGLINDVLDISKIEAGKMELDFTSVDLGEVVKGVMSTAVALVKDKPIELQQSVPEDLPIVTADERRVRQVLLNLLSNAAKFTEEGWIRVGADFDADSVTVSVADSGPGIPEEQLDEIFEPFTQVDASSTRRFGGTGLGLTITHSFIELHGGRMWVESEPGVGSTFYFSLPIEGPPSEEEEEDVLIADDIALSSLAVDEGGGKLVLCVDDDKGVLKLFRRYLNKQGYQVVGLLDSTRVVEEAKRIRPYAITLDVMMPKRDGWQVIRELKDDPETRHIPVIMCTIVSEKERGMSLGAADYLVKPIMEEDLVMALDRLDREAGRHEVLVVDDRAEDRELLRRMIESQEGYEVTEAAGGKEAIALIKKTRPHILILDLMMPEVDGFAVLESVKADETTRSIPVIVVTAKELTEEDRQILNHRIEALVQKGVLEQEELLEDVAAALRKLERAPLSGAGSGGH